MIKFLKLRTVKARLLALMAIVVLPIAFLSVILATANYRVVSKEIEAVQIQTVSGFTIRARIVLRGSLRILVGAIAGLDALEGTNADCNIVAAKTLESITKHPALWVRLDSGKICHSYQDAGFSDDILSKIASEQMKMVFVQPIAGPDIALTRYDSVRINGKLYILIYAKSHITETRNWEGILLIDPDLMQSVFNIGTIIDGTMVAFMHSANEPLVTRSSGITNSSWLPAKEFAQNSTSRWSGLSQGGGQYIYASEMIAEPNLYTLARFDGQAANAAWVQFMAMLLTPILILAVLAYTYAKAIQDTVIRWISAIETAAKSENLQPGERMLVAMDTAMPSDIGSVAKAFNRMVRDTTDREAALREALHSNNGLMRELHHRVKNSLQVIQSYIAISRRNPVGGDSIHLAETELKVQVLAIAYRFALTDTGMRPVQIKAFIEEIISNLSASARKGDQWIASSLENDAQLSVDRIIPLGLAIVEAVGAGLRASDAKNVTVSLVTLAPVKFELTIKTDGQLSDSALDAKIIRGLSLQLEATAETLSSGEILVWQFSA